MKIELLKLEELIPLEKNVRKHNDKQVAELVRSLNQFGQTRAIIIDEDNNILIGNGLYMAMKQRGDATAECSRILGLTETQKKKLVITDNKVYSLGIDDYSVISEFINDITLEGDFDIAGFDDEVVRQMTKELEDVNMDVMNYGTVPDNSFKQREPVAENVPRQDQQVQQVQNNPVQQQTPVYQQPEYTPAPTVANVQTERTIICPNCGEVIHID